MKNWKLNNLILILFCCQSIGLNAQWVTIPDAQFVNFLQTNYPACMSADQMDTTCTDITSETYLDVPWYANVFDLEGVQYFDSLQTLSAISGSVNAMPASLTNLTKLEYLNIHTNQLTAIPLLPSSLITLQCGANQISSLPDLPISLTDLNIGPNLITSLPALPDSLISIYAQGNLLTTLPDLPNTLQVLWVSNNQLTSLPDLPASLYSLLCDNNPDLYCLPVLPDGLWETASPGIIDFPGTGITCIPNIPAAASVTPLYPICQSGDLINNPNDCISLSGIYGLVYQDITPDCQYTLGENLVDYVTVRLINDVGDTLQTTTTLINGGYHFENLLSGDYTIAVDTTNSPFNSACPGSLTTSVTFNDTIPLTNINFGIACLNGSDIGVNSIVPFGIVFPGQTHQLKILAGDVAQFYSSSCVFSGDGEITVIVNGPVQYSGITSGALTPSSISGNTFTYNITDFSTLDVFNDLGLLFTVDTTATASDSICVSVTVSSTSITDVNLDNNQFNFCYSVVNSYDPNDKKVYPVQVEPEFNDWLIYTIRFQNTGTAPAFNIHIDDTLSQKLNSETFNLIAWSHPVIVGLADNFVRFQFNDIMLPDSNSNPEGSMGFVQFKIKPAATFELNDSINNEVYIYFDFNPPVITNIATVACKLPEKYAASENLIFPNPVSDKFSIALSAEYENQQTELLIYSMSGEVIKRYQFISEKFVTVNLSDVKAGMYIVVIRQNENEIIQRILKN